MSNPLHPWGGFSEYQLSRDMLAARAEQNAALQQQQDRMAAEKRRVEEREQRLAAISEAMDRRDSDRVRRELWMTWMNVVILLVAIATLVVSIVALA